ncbi:MAG: CocE/NonD family hydrolase, partial [Gemmataceae bacterium]|nr:CocE/NonD family hydrolase [Gemmataceae bacterium]
DHIRANYTKFEYKVPMRDGVRLHTAVFVPKDDSQTYPFLLIRTPYSCAPYGVDQYPDALRPSSLFVKSGYIFVVQDVRGRWMSEGEFENMRPINPAKQGKDTDESSDTFDTIEWLLKNVPGHNGKVGQTGISYPGFYTVCGMIDAHPALKAASPQAPVTDWFVGDDWHHNGAFFLPHAFNFLTRFGKPRPGPTTKYPYLPFEHGTPDGYKFFLDMGPLKNADLKHYKGEVTFWNELMRHGTYDDWWKARNVRQHVRNIKPAVLTVGGWFDAENLFGALETFKHAEANAPPPFNTLVMGPWVHGGWSRDAGDKLGDVSFNARTAEFYREQIEFPFFEFHLKGRGENAAPKAWVFETGTNRWRKFDTWPLRTARPSLLQLADGGALEPVVLERRRGEKYDEFVSDPAKPVPFINKTTIEMVPEYMTADQRFAASRPDVLVYQTPVLDHDTTVAGPIEVELFVSTTGTDADWVVKLIDVYPDDYPDPDPNPAGVRMGGYQQLVRGDVMRGKFRNSFEKPEPFKPGEVTRVRFTLPDTLHAFRPGHRLMVQVQSSWFPLVDRNPQTFCDIYSAGEKDFVRQAHRVYRDAGHPSRVSFRVIK